MRDRILLSLVGGFALGVFVQSYFPLDFFAVPFLALIGFSVFIYGRLSQKPALFFVICPALAIAFCFGAVRFELSSKPALSGLDSLVGQKIEAVGVIADEPDRRENNYHLVVALSGFSFGGRSFKTDSKVLAIADLFPDWKYGDKIKISGKLGQPENFETQSGREFNYVSYLGKEDIYFEFFKPKISLLESGQGNFVQSQLFSLKQKFIQNISGLIPEPESSLLSGLLLGGKQSLGAAKLEEFRRAGVIHIVVLSGYNITIVAEAIMKAFSFLPPAVSPALGAIGIILFAVMTGGGATVVRSAIMALLVILARVTHRDYRIKRALLAAGFFMILENPKILAFDPSFQLSFMSTLSLIYVAPLFEKHFRFLPDRFGIREVVTSTVSTQIFVLPLILFMMGQVSLVALPVNFLILAFIPATMFFGFWTGAAAFVGKLLALPAAFVAYGLLHYEIKVVEVFSGLPFAALDVKFFPVWLLALSYGAYILVIFRLGRKRDFKA